MAGGTVAMPLINEGISLPEAVMGLRLAGLDGIERKDGKLTIGATATLTQLLEPDAIPMLREAARNTASWSVRNMGTVGGNLFTPPPGGDVAVALLALDATVTLASATARRDLPLADFYTGFMTNQLADDELLVEVRVPITTARHDLHQVRPQARQHAGRRDRRRPPRVGRWDGHGRPDRAGGRRTASGPRPGNRATRASGRRSDRT